MLCRGRDSLRREHRTAVLEFRASIRDLVILVDNTAAQDQEFDLAHQRIMISRWACEVTRYDLENHRTEHGC